MVEACAVKVAVERLHCVELKQPVSVVAYLAEEAYLKVKDIVVCEAILTGAMIPWVGPACEEHVHTSASPHQLHATCHSLSGRARS